MCRAAQTPEEMHRITLLPPANWPFIASLCFLFQTVINKIPLFHNSFVSYSFHREMLSKVLWKSKHTISTRSLLSTCLLPALGSSLPRFLESLLETVTSCWHALVAALIETLYTMDKVTQWLHVPAPTDAEDLTLFMCLSSSGTSPLNTTAWESSESWILIFYLKRSLYRKDWLHAAPVSLRNTTKLFRTQCQKVGQICHLKLFYWAVFKTQILPIHSKKNPNQPKMDTVCSLNRACTYKSDLW